MPIKRGFSGRKAQITVFIIIGLIIVIAAGILIFVGQKKQEFKPTIDQIPAELEPIRTFTESCIAKLGEEAVVEIGKHGGYISLDDSYLLNTQYFIMTNNPTESDAVAFSPGSNFKIPYWYYMTSPNACSGNCRFSFGKIPPLEEGSTSIKAQIERYVNRELPKCLNNYKTFSPEFTITPTANADAKVLITDQVIIAVDYPLTIKKQTTNAMQHFNAKVPVNLKNVYDAAMNLALMEPVFGYLERYTMNLISAFSDVDRSKLPTISEYRFDFGPSTYWTKTETKNKIEGILMAYIPLMQVNKSLAYKRITTGSGYQDALYNKVVLPEISNGLSFRFNYLGWPIYFDINSEGELITPASASTSFKSFNFGMQQYEFYYDVSYPVVVEIKSPNDLNKRGYTFWIALEANIRNNAAFNESYTAQKQEDVGKSLFCNQNQRNSGNITMNITDAKTKAALKDAQISYGCGENACFIGSTDENGILNAKFPICTGGLVSFAKENYYSPLSALDTKLNEDKAVKISMEPYRTLNFTIKKKVLRKNAAGDWVLNTNPLSLSDKEISSLVLSRVNSAYDVDFVQASEFRKNISETFEISLIPGKYEVTVNDILYDAITIPKETRKESGGLFHDDIEYTIPEVKFKAEDGVTAGGLMLNNETGLWNVNAASLDSSNLVTFYIVQADPYSFRHIEDLEQMGKTSDYSAQYRRPELEPLFSRE
ncbi:hypothetical protein HYU07_00650 [Candidatus Woesearchaeota archaeon]|nr:hypothetical protein [Candidatus Woesearchaeota archaeon]